MKEKADVLQDILALMILRTLDVMGSLHGYGIARRIEQGGVSENNRQARFYRLTRAGKKQLQAERRSWEQASAIMARSFAARAEDLK